MAAQEPVTQIIEFHQRTGYTQAEKIDCREAEDGTVTCDPTYGYSKKLQNITEAVAYRNLRINVAGSFSEEDVSPIFIRSIINKEGQDITRLWAEKSDKQNEVWLQQTYPYAKIIRAFFNRFKEQHMFPAIETLDDLKNCSSWQEG